MSLSRVKERERERMGQSEEKVLPREGRGGVGQKIILNSQTFYSFHLLPINVLQLLKKIIK